MVSIATYSTYDEYQNSGAQWLGEVPKTWELTRLGTRFIERRTKVSDVDYPALSVTKQGILPQLENAAKTKDGDNRKLVKAGDFRCVPGGGPKDAVQLEDVRLVQPWEHRRQRGGVAQYPDVIPVHD